MPLFLSGNSGSATLDSSNGLIYPTWTTAGRPASPATGQCGYNTSIGGMEIYNGSAWDCITGGPAFSAYQSSSQNISSGVYTKIQLQSEEYDTANCFDSTTNYRFTPNVAGYYKITGMATLGAATWTSAFANAYIYKNGSAFKGSASTQPTNGNYATTYCVADIYFNGSTDYVELYVLCAGNAAAVAACTEAFTSKPCATLST